MAEELRLAFILLGSLAIGAVILHGVWTVRKAVGDEQKRKPKQNIEPEADEPELDFESQSLKLQQMEMDFNELQARGTKAGGLPVVNMDVDSIYHSEHSEHSEDGAEVSDPNELSDSAEVTDFTPQNELFNNGTVEKVEKQNGSHEEPSDKTIVIEQPVAADEVISEYPDLDVQDTEPKLGNWSFVTENDNEVTTNMDNISSVEIEHTNEASEPEVPTEQPQTTQQVLMLFVDKPDGSFIEGARLLPLLLTLGFKFGEMDFFHRHEHNSGQGEILFSLANMFNPGTFDPDKMEQFTTRGLTIFMTLPNALEPLQTFNMMHNAAKKIADEFGATVLDDKRRALDVSIVRGYVETIRKFNG